MESNDAFWKQAMKGLPWFRFLRRPLSISHLDAIFTSAGHLYEDWKSLKAKLEPGDQIWPFEIHVRRYLGMRKGYLALRRGKPIGGIIHIVS